MPLLANPVLTNELRGRIRGARAMIILTVYLGLIGVVTMLIYLAVVNSMAFGPNDFEAGRTIGRAIFLTVMTAALVQVCVITPALTAGSIAGEKERQSYDLLITTLLSPLQIAVGKLTAALAFALLLIVAALPLAGLSLLFGGVSGSELLIGIAGLIFTAILYATVGLFWSTIMRNSLTATVMAQGSIILVLLGVPFIFTIASVMFDGAPNDPTIAVIYVYVMGIIVCLHPFIALGFTAVLLTEGENPFYFSLPIAGQDIVVPSPWLVYVFLALVLTVLFLFLSTRLLKPVQYRLPRKKE